LSDPTLTFNDRTAADLSIKHRSMIRKNEDSEGNSIEILLSAATSQPCDHEAEPECIFDIRTVNEKVTEVFIGPNWTTSRWVSSDSIEPEARRLQLIAEFEEKIAAKQKLVSRISPAKTPSRLMSSLQLGTPIAAPLSARKRGHNRQYRTITSVTESPLSVHSASDFEADCENIHPSPTRINLPIETPLKKPKMQMLVSEIFPPLTAASNSASLLAVHSDDSSEGTDVVQLEENFEPERPTPSTPSVSKSRCVIM